MKKKSAKKISRKNKKNALETEIEEVEKWIHERRKFFRKLTWVVSLIILLIIISNLYLKVRGVGI